MRKTIDYIKLWSKWRKHNLNGRFHHYLVLFKIIKSPTFELFKGYEKAMKNIKRIWER